MRVFRNKKTIIAFIITVIVMILITAYIYVFGVPGIQKVEYTPKIELTETKAIINTGDEFNASDYIKIATDEYGNDISSRIKTVDVDTTLEGSYDIVYKYTYADDESITATLRLNVINNE